MFACEVSCFSNLFVPLGAKKMLTRIGKTTAKTPPVAMQLSLATRTRNAQTWRAIHAASPPILLHYLLIFIALIHDAGHPGAPNTQLLKEETPEAVKPQKSAAEQKLIHKTWDLLMEDEFADLQATVYSTEDKLRCFWQMFINAVLATGKMVKATLGLHSSCYITRFDFHSQIFVTRS